MKLSEDRISNRLLLMYSSLIIVEYLKACERKKYLTHWFFFKKRKKTYFNFHSSLDTGMAQVVKILIHRRLENHVISHAPAKWPGITRQLIISITIRADIKNPAKQRTAYSMRFTVNIALFKWHFHSRFFIPTSCCHGHCRWFSTYFNFSIYKNKQNRASH